MLGQQLQDLPLAWDWQHIAAGLAQCQQTLDGVSLRDVRCRWRDGKERLLGLTLSPIRGEREPLIGIILPGADITARRIMEGQLAQAQKLESIGQLAAGIAHEINTPIQYVGDNTRFLLEATQDIFQLLNCYEDFLTEMEKGHLNEDLCQSLRAFQQEMDLEFLMGDIPRAAAETLEGVKRVAKIVRAMKEFSHPGSGNKTPIDINRTVENTITVARNEWKYVADMVTDLNPDLPLVPLMSDEFSQVFLNIIINAAHAIADVAAVQNGGKDTISICTRRVGDEAEVRISDTGPGIPEAITAKVFDPFFTTKEVGRGTGQGLAIAHTIVVDKHGGRISFETEAGRGTTFIIRVPLEASSPGREGTDG
jgi:signal transduction histidine kinase